MNDDNWRVELNNILDKEKERVAAIINCQKAEETKIIAIRGKNLLAMLRSVGIPLADDADYGKGYFYIDGYRFYGSFGGGERLITVIISADTEDEAINYATKGSIDSSVYQHAGLPTLITGAVPTRIKISFAQRLDSIDRKIQQLTEEADESRKSN